MIPVPKYSNDAFQKIDDKIDKFNFNRDKCSTLYKWRNKLKVFFQLNCYGFNCAKFDLPCIAPLLFTVAQRKDMKVSFLKRSTKYISVSIDDFNFRDIMLLSVPCTLSKYLKTWKVQGCESIFPYEYFNSVEELGKYEKFPPFSAFYSN
jgi:hypothetical protein